MSITTPFGGSGTPETERRSADVIAFPNEHPFQTEEGVFGSHNEGLLGTAITFGQTALKECAQRLGEANTYIHDVIHGEYSDKFKEEFKQRTRFTTSDGVSLTARILNPEFLDNDEHAIVYSYSLLVPAEHGAELPTVADLAAHGERTGRAVIAITTDGHAGRLCKENLFSLVDFWSMPKRRFEFLRELLPPGKRLIVTGSSLGGMMSHALAATAEQESEQSGHPLHVTHDIAVASAGHHEYQLGEYPSLAFQFGLQEGPAAISYVREGRSRKQRLQRFFELLGTIPKHPSQLASVGCIAIGILRSPLKDITSIIPHGTIVTDVTFDQDSVTHPERRAELWDGSGHPNIKHIPELGPHMMLLSKGREVTLNELEQIPSGHTVAA